MTLCAICQTYKSLVKGPNGGCIEECPNHKQRRGK